MVPVAFQRVSLEDASSHNHQRKLAGNKEREWVKIFPRDQPDSGEAAIRA
jgi:hypothetical protein